jgi:hypothetical protein
MAFPRPKTAPLTRARTSITPTPTRPQIGSTFLQLKMVVDKGAGRTEDVFMELSLPQFYDFLSQMEKARTYVDFLSSST